MAVVGEIIRATVNYGRQFSSANQNVFHWIIADANEDDGDIATAVEDWVRDEWGADWAQIAASQVTLTDCVIQVVDVDGTVLRNLGEPTIGVTGIRLFTALAAATSAYLQANTDVPQIRGAKYIPGPSENELNNGAWTNEMLVNMGLLLITYLADLETGGAATLIAGVLSARTGGFQAFNNSGGVEQIPAYQRRRKPDVGI